MADQEARLKALEKAAEKVLNTLDKIQDNMKAKATKVSVAHVDNDLDAAKEDIKKIIKWIKLEAKWSTEVTKMLRLINWDLLSQDYPGGGGTNPPATPPDWPPPE